ncbi:MAG: type IV secretory system conjugative DNA transfer family protein [Steroidobacteraceae bacterium]
MTQNANAAAWSPVANPARPVLLKALCMVSAGVMAASYLAGFLLLWSLDLNPRSATPLTMVRYAYYYGDRPAVQRRLLLSLSGGVTLVGCCALALLMPRRRSLHGDARFASAREIAQVGLLGERGLILGRLGRRYLMLPGQQGVALAAPPRAGKGIGIVIPNLLNWPDSLICVDIKKENWTLTAGFRAQAGQACYLFDPFAEDGQTARWNPFFYVSMDAHKRVNDLQRIAEMLYPDPPNVDPFWTASARSLFLGIALYLFETPSLPKTIGEVLRQGMASDDEGFGHHWKRVIEGRNSGRSPLSSQCVRAMYDVIDLAPVTASSIRKTFTSRLDLWLNPILDAATSGNDFDLRELRSKPVSIYVGVNPDDLHRLRPVLALFFQQAIGLQTRVLPEHDPRLNRQVLMLLDEFTALGRIPIIAESISYLPGYNVRVMLVIQTPAQLRDVYGPNSAETMLKSLAARIAFAPKDFADAREISDELGYTTVKVQTLSRPVMDLSDAKGRKSRSVSISEQRRALLLPQEIKALGTDQALIFYESLRPICCRKIRYYADRRFTERLRAPPVQATPGARSTSEQHDVVMDDAVRPGDERPVVEEDAESGLPLVTAEVETVRAATAQDIELIDSIQLEDMAVDFNRIPLPEDGKPSEAQMHDAVQALMALTRGQ